MLWCALAALSFLIWRPDLSLSTVRAAGGTDVAFVFRWVFLAAWIFLAIGLVALILMEERPLRTSTVPAAPKASPPQSPVPAE
ncbi:MAG: hypothetical protein WEA28_05045 [Xanthobacteraceae bacterium]